MNFNDGIVSSKHKSCAALTIQCLVDSGITDWNTAFNQQITNAKKLGLMPDDFKVIRETLHNFGFVMQSTAVEGMRASNALDHLSKVVADATVLLQLSDYGHLGGYMVAARICCGKFAQCNALCDDLSTDRRRVVHVWMHWNDGIDRSPYPRRTTKQNIKKAPDRKKYSETDCYKPFQPNPCNNYIGDCVVRATAGAMDISWNKAIDILSSMNEVTVNAREVYPSVLVKHGFIHCHPLTRSGRHLNGKDFCEEMNKYYHNGERIFAHVGRLHVAAIVPVSDNGGTSYKIVDSWDSSTRLIGDYWVLPMKSTKSDCTAPKTTRSTNTCVRKQLYHPSFGRGVITEINAGVLLVDFEEVGARRLGEEWVRRHCSFIGDGVGDN